MRYEVPQFIDIEDKIFGPLTFKQALYILGSGGAAFMVFYALGRVFPELSVVIKLAAGSPFVAIGLALAFVKVNKRPLIFLLESAFYYYLSPKRYIWKKSQRQNQRNIQHGQTEQAVVSKRYVPTVSKNKLKDLAWSLDMESNLDNE